MADGIASKDTTIGPIDVSQLIGRANPDIVGPRATAALGDAFRSGFITADDVLNRVGEKGRAQEKAQIDIANAQSMSAQEQTSPEAQAARAAQLGNVVPGAELQAQQVEKQKVLLQYPAIAYFDKFAPIAGIQAPTLPDGTPDYKEMEKIGAEMAVWQSNKTDAQKELDNINRETSADGLTLFAVTKQGQPVDSTRVRQLESKATSQFRRQAPGSVSMDVAPRVQPAPATAVASAPAVNADAARAQMVNAGMPAEQAVQISDVDVVSRAAPAAAKPMVSIAENTTGVPQVGSPVPGGISLGPPKEKVRSPELEAAESQKLAAAQAMLPVIDNALAAIERPGSVGPAAGSAPVVIGNQIAAAFGFREQQFKDQRTLEMSISSKVLEGAQVLKGNLSDRDILFLKATAPKLSDSKELWKEYLTRWRNMAQLNIDIAGGRATRSPSGVFAPANWAPTPEQQARANEVDSTATLSPAELGNAAAAAQPPSKNPVITLPSGKRVQRDSRGNFQAVQ